jgi:16S rRNA (cytosine967-C5)-methyltransferase
MKSSPRTIAVEILGRIDAGGSYAEPLLDAALSSHALDNPHDRALLTELVYGTLRMRGFLDWIIAQLYRGDAATLDAAVKNILRTGLYQLRFTERIPPFAAVNEAVGIARDVSPAAAGLVNAILRNALRRKETLAWPDTAKEPEKAIAVLYSHPAWLVRRLLAQFDGEETIAICRANNTVPPLTLRVNTLKASRQKALEALNGAGFTHREGLLRIQDEASQLIAHLVAPEPGEQLLDLCAGAGGKTLHLAALMQNRGTITALDRHPGKLRMLRTEAERLGATIVETRTADAAQPPETFQDGFARVLLDAPCSGLGTLRRNPEIRWRLTPSEINRCMKTQKGLLLSAAQCVQPGGRLIYSVCTVTPEENEIVVNDFLKKRPDFNLMRPANLPPALIDAAGFLRSSPWRHDMDGFFGAVLLRRP